MGGNGFQTVVGTVVLAKTIYEQNWRGTHVTNQSD